MDSMSEIYRRLHSETGDSFKKYKSFFRPAKYLVPVAIFALLMGSCDPEAAPPGTDPPAEDPPTEDPPAEDPIDPATIIDVPSFAAPVALSISWLVSASNYSIFHPALADMDGDGDLDILVGYKQSFSSSPSYFDRQGIIYLENTTATDLEFVQDNSAYTNLPRLDTQSWSGSAVGAMIPAVNDIDGNLGMDIVCTANFHHSFSISNFDGVKIIVARNDSNNFNTSGFISSTSVGSYTSSSYYISMHMATALTNLDEEADIDLITAEATIMSMYGSSAQQQKVNYIANDGTGTFLDDSVTETFFTEGPISAVSTFPIPSFADIDNDGDMDMFTVTYKTGDVTFYLNTGTAASPAFEAQASAFSVLPTDVKYFPAFGDMDGDTDVDVIAGTNDGKLWYIENTDIE